MGASYSAFISYKHHAGLPFAERIAKALRVYGRSRLRPPLRVFRDEEYLLPNESLPATIRGALGDSKFLILLASRAAAESVWVCDELRVWCAELKRSSRLLIVLTADEITFDTTTMRVDWASTTALPPFLSEHIHDVPLYVDLRNITDERQLDLAHADFKKEINRLAASVNEIDPESMLNKEVIAHRRDVWLARGAVITLAVLTALALAGFFVANAQRTRAETALANEQLARERAEAEAQAAAANLLATRAQQTADQSPQLAALLAAEAVHRLQARNLPVTTAAAQTLLDLLQSISGIGLGGHRLAPLPEPGRGEQPGTFISAVAISPDSNWIATGDGDGRILLRRRTKPQEWLVLRPGKPTSGLAHEEEIHGLEFSADSTRLAASKFDEVLVWDISGSATEVARCAGHGTYVHDVHFAGGNRWLVSASQSGIRVWDTEATPPSALLLPGSDGAYRAVVAGNGELVVSARGQVWRWREGQPLEPLPGFTGEFFSIAASAAGDRVAVGTTEGLVHVWTLAARSHQAFEQGGLINSVAFGLAGDSVASASSNRTVRLWDLTGKNRPVTFEHPDEVRAVAFRPSGQILATVGRDKYVRLWSTNWLSTGAPVLLGGLTGDGSGDSVTFSPDGSLLLSGGYEPLPRLWSLDGLNHGVQVLPGSNFGNYESVTARGTPPRLAAVERYGGPDLWNLDGAVAHRVSLAKADRNNAFQVELSADGTWLATSGVGASSYLWNITTPNVKPRELRARTNYRNKIVFSPDSRLIAGLHQDGSILLESTTNADQSPTVLPGDAGPAAIDLAFHPEGTHLAAIYPDGSAFLWDVRGTSREPVGAPDQGKAVGVGFSPDGRHLALAHASFVEWRSLQTRASIRLSAPDGVELEKVIVAPNSAFVAAGTKDGTTVLWDVSGDPKRLDLAGHVEEVVDVTFAPDSQWLASATSSAIRLWSIRDLSAAPLRLAVPRVRTISRMGASSSSALSGIVFLPDQRLAAATGNHEVVTWDLGWERLVALACQAVGRGLNPQEVVDQLDGKPSTTCVTAEARTSK